MFDRSNELFSLAKRDIPGGVNSPVRAFNGVGGTPLFVARAEGARLFDADDNEYIDYVGSWGPMIVGHRHPAVVAAISEQLSLGVSFGAPTALETTLASKIKASLPSVDKVRFVSSGTEAAMSAIRLARGITGRAMILKFEGCYHGHADSLLVKAGSGALTLGVPSSAGVPSELAKLTLTAPYNDLAAVKELFKQFGRDIAAVIVEPIAGNMNCVLPQPDFLSGLRAITREYDSLLIFDEVITGFRVHPGSAQALFNVAPDLTVLGKVIGGGLPVGAFAGPGRFMDHIAPDGPVYQAGTLSGNPLAMACGLATLELISTPVFHAALSAQTDALVDGLLREARAAHIPMTMNHVTGLFGIFFTEQPAVTSFAAVSRCNVDRFKRFFHGMLAQGIYFAPSAYEAGFVSSAHRTLEIDQTLAAARAVFKSL